MYPPQVPASPPDRGSNACCIDRSDLAVPNCGSQYFDRVDYATSAETSQREVICRIVISREDPAERLGEVNALRLSGVLDRRVATTVQRNPDSKDLSLVENSWDYR